MLNKVQFSNPVLRYKLDPGEPGMPYPSKASMSIARVASHELGNIIRFRQKAAREGGIVVGTKIYLNLKARGSYLAATSGYSEARIIYPNRRRTPAGVKEATPADFDNAIGKDISGSFEIVLGAEEDILSAENKTGSILQNESMRSLQNELAGGNIDLKIKELEQEQIMLSVGVDDISRKIFTTESNGSLKNEKIRKQDEVRKIKRELAYLKIKKELEKQNELLSKFSSQISLSSKIIKSRYNINNSYSEGDFINLLG